MEANTPKTCHAAELVAGLTAGRAITDTEIQQAQQTQDFAQGATLDDLAATSAFFDVPLQLLRREREPVWEALGCSAEDRQAVLEDQRNLAAVRLIGWIDALAAFGLLAPDNADELRYQLLDLRDDTPGATAQDARTPFGTR